MDDLIARSPEEAFELLRDFEMKSVSKFSVVKKTQNFGKTEPSAGKHMIRFSDRSGTTGWRNAMQYDGTPFVIAGKTVLDCQHGKDRKISFKKKYHEQKKEEGMQDHVFARRKTMIQTTKKLNCPAQVLMREIIKYPDYKIEGECTKKKMETTSKRLRADIENGTVKTILRLIYIQLPIDHKNHISGEFSGMAQPIDKRLVSNIKELVTEGVTDAHEVKRHLKFLVQKVLFVGKKLPEKTNRRFYPSMMEIRTHINKSKNEIRKSIIDQENLKFKIEQWKHEHPDDNYVLRMARDDDNEGRVNFLFAQQTQWQQRLFQRYGHELVLLDATYRTSKYALPLFFIVVKTNINYIVVGSFIIEDETRDSIVEALQIFKQWNKNVEPRYFMTDYCEEEIQATEIVFPGCMTYICRFHLEQAFERWTSKIENGVSHQKAEVLAKLRRVANASTEAEFNQELKSLKSSEIWTNNRKLQKWFENYWLKHYKRWVLAYRQERLLININTNNGIERQNKEFKYAFLNRNKDKKVSDMVDILVNSFLPDKYNNYLLGNVRQSGSYRQYNVAIPGTLQERPHHVIKHCMDKLKEGEEIPSDHIVRVSEKVFSVKSQSGKDLQYTIQLGDEKILPSCTCPNWRYVGLPCKHMCAVISTFDNTFECLPHSYWHSPFFTLDIETHDTDGSTNRTDLNILETDDGDGLENTTDSDKGHLHELPLPKKSFRSIASKCREILKEISSLTYLVHDNSSLAFLQSDLSVVLETFQKVVPREDDLCIYPEELPVTKPKKIRHENTASASDFRCLPRVRKRKHPFTGRVGAWAETMRKNFKSDKGVDELVKDHNQFKPNCDDLVGATKIKYQPVTSDCLMTEVHNEVQYRMMNNGKDGNAEGAPDVVHVSKSQEKQNMTVAEEKSQVVLVNKVKDYVASLHDSKWRDKIKASEDTKTASMDMPSRLGFAVLEEYCSNDDDNMDAVAAIGNLAPVCLDVKSKYRLVNIILSDMVCKKILKITNDPRLLDIAGSKAMKKLIEAMKPEPIDIENSTRQSCASTVITKTVSSSTFTEDQKKSRFQKLSREILECNDRQLNSKRGTRYDVSGSLITADDFSTLSGSKWLNDKIVNGFLKLLMTEQNHGDINHIYVMTSFLPTLWSRGDFDSWLYRKVQLSQYQWVFLPVNLHGNHWVLLAANIQEKTVSVLYSMNSRQNLSLIEKWKKYMHVRGGRLGELQHNWTVGSLKSAKQQDSSSCGPFVLLNALALVRDIDQTLFTMKHAYAVRRYVKTRLIGAMEKPPELRKVCDMVGCTKPKSDIMRWVNCDVCERWCHWVCVGLITFPSGEFQCPICLAQYS